MKKHFAAALAILMAALMCACSLVSVNEEKDMARVAAKVGDTEITKGEVYDLYQQYSAYASWMGLDISTESGRLDLVDMVLEDLLYNEVVKYQAKQKGYYNFTDEKRAEIDAEVQENYDYFLNEARAAAEDEYAEDPDIDVEARTDELLKEATLSSIGEEHDKEGLRKFLVEYFEDSYASQVMRDEFNLGISVSEDEVRAAYDEKLSSDKEELTQDPGAYKTNQEDIELYGDEMPTLYTPEGYIRVRVITVSPEAEIDATYTEKRQEISGLTLELGNLTLAEQDEATAAKIEEIKAKVKTLEDETKAIYDEYLSAPKSRITEAYDKLNAGADFTEIMLEYGEDSYFTDYEIFREKGRLMSANESTSDWPETVKSAALKLTTPGAYTDVIEGVEEDTYAYYIVQYVGKEPAGEKSYEEMRDAMEAETLSTKQSNEWEALVDEWLADTALVKKYDDVIKSVGA